MSILRRALLALVLFAGLTPAFAQAPPPVPGLPDTERRTSYSISGTACICNVNFALYGDSTDFNNWVEVFLNGVRVNYNDATFGWAITSPTGSLAIIPRPVTDAILTFTNAQTGVVQIVGARRPRRTSQFSENRGVAARDLNQAFTDVIATMRETWDKTNDVTGRAILGLPGETVALLPSAASRAGKFFVWDGSGNPTVTAPSLGTGNVLGPGSSVVNGFARWNNTAGTLLKDGGLLVAADLPAGVPTNTLNSQTSNYSIATTDCGKTVQAGTGSTGFFTVTLPSVSGFAATCTVTVTNGDTARGKKLSGFPTGVGSTPILWPSQSITVAIVNGAWVVTNAPARWIFSALVTVYFDPANGHDDGSTDCLASGTAACLTLQHAWDMAVASYDLAGQSILFQGAANQTYTNAGLNTGSALLGQTDPGKIAVDFGAGSSTCNMTNGTSCLELGNSAIPPALTIQNVKFTASNGGALDVQSATVYGGAGLNFGTVTGAHLAVKHGGGLYMLANYTISGNAVIHLDAESGGLLVTHGLTLTCSGSPAFTYFVYSSGATKVYASSMTFSSCGGVTTSGPRYVATENGIIDTGGANNASYFPGNSSGGAWGSGGRIDSTGLPTITGCGTSPGTPVGSDIAGTVTEGTSATGCTITFANGANAILSTGSCMVLVNGTPPSSFAYSYTNAAITVTHGSASGTKLSWWCNN